MPEEVEVGLEVWVSVGVVLPDTVAFKVPSSSSIKRIGESITSGLATGCVAGPAGGVIPLVPLSRCVDVNGDQADVLFAEIAAMIIHTSHPLLQADIVFLRHKQLSIIPPVLEVSTDGSCNEAVLSILQEAPVWRALSLRITAMAVVN